ncbi:unnamed protein product [Phytophthora lilii]|uniref:Unnamed protein product n=1 Tax=Phytophthora lilii TaxID=2077276 RepID=A0A9W7D9C3_9STRA|nr:unnamed protein product [Phytophthora lilii]
MTTLLVIPLSAMLVHAASASNWVGIYRYANFSGLVQGLRDIKTQTCYNVLCEDVNNLASSAAWLGWIAAPSGNGLPRITFFLDKDCKGAFRGYEAGGTNYPSDFSADDVDNKITSLIVYDRNFIDVDETITFCKGSTE